MQKNVDSLHVERSAIHFLIITENNIYELKKVSDGLHPTEYVTNNRPRLCGGDFCRWILFCGCRCAKYSGQACYLPGCCFYGGNQCMCYGTFHSCYGDTVE